MSRTINLFARIGGAFCLATSVHGAVYSVDSITVQRDGTGSYPYRSNGTLEIAPDITYDTIILTTRISGPANPPFVQPDLLFAHEQFLTDTLMVSGDELSTKLTLDEFSSGPRTGGSYSDFMTYALVGDAYQTPNGVYPVSLTDSSFGPSVLLLNGQVVDTISFAQPFTVTVVPEPSTAAMVLFAGLSVLPRWRP